MHFSNFLLTLQTARWSTFHGNISMLQRIMLLEEAIVSIKIIYQSKASMHCRCDAFHPSFGIFCCSTALKANAKDGNENSLYGLYA